MAADAPPGVVRWLVPVGIIVVLVVLASLGIPWLLAPGGGPDLVLVEVSGDVSVGGDGGPQRATAGRIVDADEQVRTGPSSTAVLAAGPDVELRLAPDTSMRVDHVDSESVVVELDEGRVRAEVERGSRAVRVGSNGRAVTTRDGAFTVAAADGVFAVDVERGTATASGIPGVDSIAAGGRVTALPDGSNALGPIPDDVVLSVAWPGETRTKAEFVDVSGTTAPGATVVLSGGSERLTVRADSDGRFTARLPLEEGRIPVVVEATDPFGNSVSDSITVEVDRTPPSLRGGRVEEGAP